MKPPPGVPAPATWNEDLERFEHGEAGPRGQRHGEWRAWDSAGALRETSRWVDGVRHGVARRFDAGGGLREEGAFESDQPVGVWRTFDELGRLEEEAEYADGVRHGQGRRYAGDGTTVDATSWRRGVREGVRRLGPVRGRCADDVPVGDWEYLGPQDVVLRTASVRVRDEGEVLRTGDAPEALLARSARLVKEGRLAEALVAAARAGGQLGDPGVFVSQLAANALPFTRPDTARLTARYVDETPSLRALLAGLVIGLHAPTLLATLAARLDELGRPRVALELLNAAVLLTPRDEALREARAHALLGLWLPGLVDADLQRLPLPARARVEGLRALAAAPFHFSPATGSSRDGRDDLVPAGAPLSPPAAERPRDAAALADSAPTPASAGRHASRPSIAQPLPAVRAVLACYAGRLARLGAALEGIAALPDVSALGPTSELPAPAALEPAHLAPWRALELAQADWRALCTLCWAVGLDQVARPASIAPRLGLPVAVAAEEARCRALAAQAGADPLAEARLRQALETLAMFRWLTKNDAASPWEGPLREP